MSLCVLCTVAVTISLLLILMIKLLCNVKMSQNRQGPLLYLFLVTAVLLGACVPVAEGYKHVVFMHGIFAGPSEFDYFTGLIQQQLHPGTPITAINSFRNLKSLKNLQEQLTQISNNVRSILTNRSSDGTILICFSQGGLVCRGLLSVIKHNVETFISLSSPLAGQYGDTDYLKYLFPKFIKKNIYKLFYSKNGQKFSIANYWNDHNHQTLYKRFSQFLAYFNNESSTGNPRSFEFRSNFLRLKNLVLVGGPNDGVITPWQSSHFGMYNSSEIVLPMEKQKWFQNDAFGLKTLASRRSIHKHVIRGVRHVRWHAEKRVFDTCIKPWLT